MKYKEGDPMEVSFFHCLLLLLHVGWVVSEEKRIRSHALLAGRLKRKDLKPTVGCGC